MGEQIYRLVIVDFLFLMVLTFTSEFLRRYNLFSLLNVNLLSQVLNMPLQLVLRLKYRYILRLPQPCC